MSHSKNVVEKLKSFQKEIESKIKSTDEKSNTSKIHSSKIDQNLKKFIEILELSKTELTSVHKTLKEQEKKNIVDKEELEHAYLTIEAQETVSELSRIELQSLKEQLSALRQSMPPLETELSSKIMDYTDSQEEKLLQEFGMMRGKTGDNVYVDILRILINVTFNPEEAEVYWRDILQHMEDMNRAIGRSVGIRVAILDYFYNIKKMLINPKIVEINLFDSAMKYALRDELTGIYNRKFYEISLGGEVSRSTRNQKPFCLLVLDIDNFKLINDTEGHDVGDQALKHFGYILNESSRKEDIVCRYGGEEFVIILPETSKEKALSIGKRVQNNLAKKSEKKITFSGGISCFPLDTKDPDQLFILADKAMYAAKESGKNKIIVHQ